MLVSINDEAVEVAEQTTVAALLEGIGLLDKGIALAVNWVVIPRSECEAAPSDGARVEVVMAAQGGLNRN
jgi:sulfur carrier protein